MLSLSGSFCHGYLLLTTCTTHVGFSIHHYGMEMLKDTNLEVFQQFSFHGKFTVVRTKNRFSKMCLDQLHKQLKEDINSKQC